MRVAFHRISTEAHSVNAFIATILVRTLQSCPIEDVRPLLLAGAPIEWNGRSGTLEHITSLITMLNERGCYVEMLEPDVLPSLDERSLFAGTERPKRAAHAQRLV